MTIYQIVKRPLQKASLIFWPLPPWDTEELFSHQKAPVLILSPVFFTPAYGIIKDKVRVSAHTILTPYWATRLGKKKLVAKQVSTRGGDLKCELSDDRV